MALFADCSLCSSEAGDRDTVRAAGNVVQADLMAELNGSRVAAVFTADAQLDVRAGLTAQLGSHLDQLADANLIEVCKRIELINLTVIVIIR